jgi:hypothetical protein
MKKLFIGIMLLIFVAACTNVNDLEKACTKDAKLCPDGSAVGRDSDNNCEFEACPQEKYDVRYMINDPTECSIALIQCLEGTEAFVDEKGCGCRSVPKKYVSMDLDECSRIRYMCEEGLTPFTDDFGCGCGFDWGLMPEPVPEDIEGKKVTHACKERSEACTMEYTPVCGWFGKNIQCIKYPCAADYGNPCTACADEKVEYWTEGECPSEDFPSGYSDRDYLSRDPDQCAMMGVWNCEEGMHLFSDDTGCGCAN